MIINIITSIIPTSNPIILVVTTIKSSIIMSTSINETLCIITKNRVAVSPFHRYLERVYSHPLFRYSAVVGIIVIVVIIFVVISIIIVVVIIIVAVAIIV